MNERQRATLEAEALLISAVVLSELRLSDVDAQTLRDSVFTALVALESSRPGARLFVEHFRAQASGAAELLEGFRRLVELGGLCLRVARWVGSRATWG